MEGPNPAICDTAAISDDELNIMKSEILETPLFSSDRLNVNKTPRPSGRTLRPRVVSLHAAKVGKKHRKIYGLNASGHENALLSTERAEKKVKLEKQKAKTVANKNRKLEIDVIRRQWLRRHLDLFAPLLPPDSQIIATLQAETCDETLYTPLHQLEEQPALIKGGQMKDYQLQGLSFLAWMYNNGMNCILGDEMGLGKTLQTLSLFAYIKENTPESSEPPPPHLILCPLSVLSSWMNEIKRWLPSFRALQFHGQQGERENLKASVKSGVIQFDICVTTYEMFVSDGWFKMRSWSYCVLDEGHKIKNTSTNLANSLQGIGAHHRLILSGTPLQNDMVELWGLFHWLYPGVFTNTSQQLFKDAFNLSKGHYSLEFMGAAQKLLSTIMLRRTKSFVELSVPPREETNVYLPISELQRFWSYRMITRLDTLDLHEIFPTKFEDGVQTDEGRKEVAENIALTLQMSRTGGPDQWKRLMNLVMQLRQICDHPYMLEDAAPDPYYIGEHLVAASSKFVAIEKLLADILPKGEKVLIFTQFVGMLDLLDDLMRLRNIPFARLDGSTLRPRRTLDIKLFQQEDSPIQVYLISTKAGGLGINLTKASHVIMCDSDFNPQVHMERLFASHWHSLTSKQNDLQAIARAHRIGQTKTVKVYRLICAGSVEDQMFEFIRRKLFLSVKVLGLDNSSPDESPSLRKQEVLNILRRGTFALDDGTSSYVSSMDTFISTPIQEILRSSAERERVREAKVKEEVEGVKAEEDLEALALEEERQLLSGVAKVRGKLFEGQDLSRSSNKQIAKDWEKLQKREHVDRFIKFNGVQHIVENTPDLRIASLPKRKRAEIAHEDYCNYCRDGGTLVLCTLCPRVFHPECHGLHPAEVKSKAFISCSQHECADCARRTADAGGMLFRCRTCPNAFCEDCLPPGEIDIVGPTLPEFLVLGVDEIAQAYFINCAECVEHFRENPKDKLLWEIEFKEAEKKLTLMGRW